jgi:DNA mismatch endonuclease (patch repair protein)
MDKVSVKVRSATMSRIRNKGTRLELEFRGALQMCGVEGHCEHPNWLGHPDFAFENQGVVIFLDSCFWHKCPLHFRSPKSRCSYWTAKIRRNVERDRSIRREYRKNGWVVLRFWEHAVHKNADKCALKTAAVVEATGLRNIAPLAFRRTPNGGVPFPYDGVTR